MFTHQQATGFPHQQATGTQAENRLVYVVDDDAAVREAMDSLIRSAGFNVRTFESARDFLESRHYKGPSCLVLDVGLPGLNGLDLQRELMRAEFNIPIIFVTGQADVPMSVRAMKAGAVEFLTKPFREEDLLGAIGQAIERDRHSQPARSERQKELESAARIQQGLMAVMAQQPSFAAVSARNLPCAEIGGDFFTAFPVDECLVFAIADVCGKGIAAAVMASLLQGMIHEGLRTRVRLPEIGRNINEFFCMRDLGSKYATCVIVCVQPNGYLEYLNCGHVRPLVVRAGGRVVRLPESNLPVGLLPNVVYQSAGFHLRRADRIVLVTDGVTEAENADGDFFGDQRLEEFAATGMTVEDIFNSVRKFCAGSLLTHDCTVIGLEYLG
jgi:FixJ family two-component response regulator